MNPLVRMAQLATNNRAKYDYDIKQTFDAGLVLEGREVKAVKQGNVSLSGAYVTVHADGAYLINCHIGPYKYAPNTDYEPTHSRKILLKKTGNQFPTRQRKRLGYYPARNI
jgi:SsrA-binding protein